MGKQLENISPDLATWIAEQQIFFVATSPLGPQGHINLSPKGGDSLRVLGPMEVAYEDYTGSGAETIAHLRENGRIVIMLCAFVGPPRIVRLHGRGTAILPSDERFAALAARFPGNPGRRSIVQVKVTRVSSSCGYSVPFFKFEARREILDDWACTKGPDGLNAYRAQKNVKSVDGLPAIDHVD